MASHVGWLAAEATRPDSRADPSRAWAAIEAVCLVGDRRPVVPERQLRRGLRAEGGASELAYAVDAASTAAAALALRTAWEGCAAVR